MWYLVGQQLAVRPMSSAWIADLGMDRRIALVNQPVWTALAPESSVTD